MKTLHIFTDGGARGNPGPAGIGVHAEDEKGQVLYQYSGFLGKATNNMAEYQGLIKALEWVVGPGRDSVLRCPKHADSVVHCPYKQINFYLDSKLVVEQIKKNWQIKEPHLQKLAEQAWMLLGQIQIPYSLEHVRREKNKLADALANRAMDAATQNLLQ